MKDKIKYILLLIFIGAIAFSCQKDDEYTLKEYNPKGGFIQKDLTIESGKYLKNTSEDVELVLNFNRFDNTPLEAGLEIAEVEPSGYTAAFSLIASSVTVNQKNDTINVGQIDWSVLKPDSSVYVTLNIVADETLETGTNTKSITIEFHKEAAPIIDLGNTTSDMYFSFGSTDDINTTIQLDVLNKPAEEEISIPLQTSFGLTEGTHFDIDQTLVVPVGSTTASFDLTVYNDAFADNERGNIWLEIHEEDIPEGLSVELSDSYWFGYRLGKTGEIIKLITTKAYEAKINPAFDTEPTKDIQLEVKVSDFPVLNDLEIPVTLNQYYAKEGTHFLMPQKVLKIEKGDTTGTIEFEMLPENYNLGDTIRLWVQLDTDYDAGTNVSYDATDWWTSVDLIKLDAYIATLDQSAEYDALISDVTTDVDVDILITDLLDKAAPSDLEIPIQFNESYIQTGTHFNSDGIIRVNSGETSGTLTITVIGSAFSAGESNSLWIELHDEDMPTSPIIISNPDNWWTTINVGKN